jgi:hypothetical protein
MGGSFGVVALKLVSALARGRESIGRAVGRAPLPDHGFGSRARRGGYAFAGPVLPWESVSRAPGLSTVRERAAGLVDLFRGRKAEDRPPLVLSVLRLAAWILAGAVLVSAVLYFFGSIAVRTAVGFFG